MAADGTIVADGSGNGVNVRQNNGAVVEARPSLSFWDSPAASEQLHHDDKRRGVSAAIVFGPPNGTCGKGEARAGLLHPRLCVGATPFDRQLSLVRRRLDRLVKGALGLVETR